MRRRRGKRSRDEQQSFPPRSMRRIYFLNLYRAILADPCPPCPAKLAGDDAIAFAAISGRERLVEEMSANLSEK